MIEHVIQFGDQVVINDPANSRQYHGTTARVIGFETMVYDRIYNLGVKPGIYANRSYPRLLLNDGIELGENAWYLEMVDSAEYKRRVQEWIRKGRKIKNEFWMDLPETQFYECDTVLVREPKSTHIKNPAIVTRIEWHSKRSWSDPWKYRVSINLDQGLNEPTVDESNMELVERGNVWKYFHNQPLQFKDLMDEASFFVMLGHTREVRNPATKLYGTWTRNEFLKAMKVGIVDAVDCLRKIPSSPKEEFGAIRFKDKSLGARIREATLAKRGIKGN